MSASATQDGHNDGLMV